MCQLDQACTSSKTLDDAKQQQACHPEWRLREKRDPNEARMRIEFRDKAVVNAWR